MRRPKHQVSSNQESRVPGPGRAGPLEAGVLPALGRSRQSQRLLWALYGKTERHAGLPEEAAASDPSDSGHRAEG